MASYLTQHFTVCISPSQVDSYLSNVCLFTFHPPFKEHWNLCGQPQPAPSVYPLHWLPQILEFSHTRLLNVLVPFMAGIYQLLYHAVTDFIVSFRSELPESRDHLWAIPSA